MDLLSTDLGNCCQMNEVVIYIIIKITKIILQIEKKKIVIFELIAEFSLPPYSDR